MYVCLQLKAKGNINYLESSVSRVYVIRTDRRRDDDQCSMRHSLDDRKQTVCIAPSVSCMLVALSVPVASWYQVMTSRDRQNIVEVICHTLPTLIERSR